MGKIKKAIIKDIFRWEIKNWSKFIDFIENALKEVFVLTNNSIDDEGNIISDTALKDKIAVELGADEGGLSIYLALRGFRTKCTDLTNPYDRAKKNHIKYSIEKVVEYQAIDITKIPYPDNSFDLIILKSVLVMLGDIKTQEKAIKEIYRVLKPGGILLACENIKGSYIHRKLRRIVTPWRGRTNYLSINEIKNLYSNYSSLKLNTYGFFGVFGWRFKLLKEILCLIDSFIIKFIPEDLRYIGFIYAKK